MKYSTLCKYAPPKETKIESVGFGFFVDPKIESRA